MKWLIVLSIFFSLTIYAQEWLPPDVVLQKLLEGNQRFAEDQLKHPRQSLIRREALIGSQWPCAIILSCSDSRVPPEIVFDQGVGDLFVVRVAGNVAGPLEIDSVEFAAVYLKSSLIIVLGHENCGAVQAVLNGTTKDIEAVAALIEPAVQKSRIQEGDRLEKAIKYNIRLTMETLQQSSALQKMVKEGALKIIGAYYELKSGKILLIDDFK